MEKGRLTLRQTRKRGKAGGAASGHFRAEENKKLVTHDESEEIDAEVCEDVAHLPVGVHGAADDLSRDP